ncbi:hypothetical protein ACFL6G_06425 [candidate division KSB1 bacterium]
MEVSNIGIQNRSLFSASVGIRKYSAELTIDTPEKSYAVKFEHTEVNAEFGFYDSKGKLSNAEQIQQIAGKDDITTGDVTKLKSLIHEEVLAQVKDSLGTYFKENPEAAEQVSRGEIPEYFNVENTARRILDIYFSRYEEGEDKTSFVERAKEIINQAYGDVEGMVGELPEIVLQTRDKIMEILDRFAAGEDISDFMTLGTDKQ